MIKANSILIMVLQKENTAYITSLMVSYIGCLYIFFFLSFPDTMLSCVVSGESGLNLDSLSSSLAWTKYGNSKAISNQQQQVHLQHVSEINAKQPFFFFFFF